MKFEKQFIAEYIKNGQNGTKAYLTVRPGISERSAAVCATRLLRKPEVIEEINKAVGRDFDKAVASREHLINEADEIGKEARQQGAYGSALKAVELKGKLNRVFDDTDDHCSQFKAFVQQFTINVKPGDDDKAIDVTPES